ncbi:MAG: DNA/RNA non-specific endonuclease, partial [Chitinophagaceae bacterium]|nr:DNA/RNA non-specific endonuclease [Chitinophagaceae bacterium]
LVNGRDKIMDSEPGSEDKMNTPDPLNQEADLHSGSTGRYVFNFNNITNLVINAGSTPDVQGAGSLPGVQEEEKKLRFDEVYSNRRYKGYKPAFLGVDIPVPEVKKSRMEEIHKKVDTEEALILKYYHYSLVMNEKFRLQMWSAVNVDYDPVLKPTKEREDFGDGGNSWRPDPRIPVEIQLTNEEFYKPATQIDRGHMVRRDDSCYGNTELEIEYANSDTFHWTNCTPQHEGFNQSRQAGLWGRLEDAVKEGLQGDDTKVSIFAGPVLKEDEDRMYNGIYYPVKFWKVIAAIDEEEGLLAYGFILDQSKVVDRRGLEARFDFSEFRNQQVSLKKIEEEAGIIFPKVLKEADIFVKNNIPLEQTEEFESKEGIMIQVKR